MPAFTLENKRPFRLVPAETTRASKGFWRTRGTNGGSRHWFGGPANHKGVVPKDSNVAVQLVLSLDLTDPLIPIACDGDVTRLPLYYPFKFGIGGPEIQYAVHSDTEIEILYMSDPKPDELDSQYLQVDELPQLSLDLLPLTYEEERCLCFDSGYYQPNKRDLAIHKRLGLNNLIRLGGQRDIRNGEATKCRNPDCEHDQQLTHAPVIATVPPIPVNGVDDFWHEFQGGYVHFCFALCHYCGTVIAFNVA